MSSFGRRAGQSGVQQAQRSRAKESAAFTLYWLNPSRMCAISDMRLQCLILVMANVLSTDSIRVSNYCGNLIEAPVSGTRMGRPNRRHTRRVLQSWSGNRNKPRHRRVSCSFVPCRHSVDRRQPATLDGQAIH